MGRSPRLYQYHDVDQEEPPRAGDDLLAPLPPPGPKTTRSARNWPTPGERSIECASGLLDQLKELDFVQSKETEIKTNWLPRPSSVRGWKRTSKPPTPDLAAAGTAGPLDRLTIEEMRKRLKTQERNPEAWPRCRCRPRRLASRAGEQAGHTRRMFFELKDGRVTFIDVPTLISKSKTCSRTGRRLWRPSL